jgi:hypothetical protein
MISQLNELEIAVCTHIAKLRKQSNRKANPNDPVANAGLEPHYIEREGVLSELAFSKLVNVYPEELFIVSNRSVTRGEDNGDLTVNGVCIDVKTTKHQSGRLVSFRKNPNVDLIVLMTGENGYYRFAGGLPSDDMYQQYRWGIPSKMKQYCFSAEQEELMTVKQVFDLLG